MLLSLIAWFNRTLSGLTAYNQDSNEGQGLVEYALILVLVAVVVIIILSVVGTVVSNQLYGNIVEALN